MFCPLKSTKRLHIENSAAAQQMAGGKSDDVVIISEEVWLRGWFCVTRPVLCCAVLLQADPPFRTEEAAALPPGQGLFLSIWMQTVGGLEASTQTSVSGRQGSWESVAVNTVLSSSLRRCLSWQRVSLKKKQTNNLHTFITDIYVRLAARQHVCFMTFKTRIYPLFSSRLCWRPSSAEC